MTTATAASGYDPHLLHTLESMLFQQRPLSEPLLRAAHTAAAAARATAGADNLARHRGRNVHVLLAGCPRTPTDLLTDLAGDDHPEVRGPIVSNPAAPLPARVAVLTDEDRVERLRELADGLTHPDLLTVLADRALAAPRPNIRSRWVFVNYLDASVPVDECVWEDVAARLLANPHLPTDVGDRLVTSMLPFLHADLVDARQDAVFRPEGVAEGTRSIPWSGVRAYLTAHPDLADDLARRDGHPWILTLAAARDDADPALVEKAIWTLVLPVLRGPGDRADGIPAAAKTPLLQLADRISEPTLAEVRAAMEGWDLKQNSALHAIRNPPPPEQDPATDTDRSYALFSRGPVADVLTFTDAVSTFDKRRPRRPAVDAFLARRDVDTDTALRVAGAYSALDEAALTARSFDRDFAVRILTHAPGYLDRVADDDLALEVIARMLDPEIWTRQDPASACIPDDLLHRLGSRILELAWPRLTRLAGRDAEVDTLVADTLGPALATEPGRRLFTALSPTHTGTLPALVDAVTGTLTPAAG